jgi:hypothetical protein
MNSETQIRPYFREGQILGAADLNGVVNHAGDRHARHDRYLHSWGIADGLRLEGAARQTPGGEPYIEITITPGVLVDGTGREVVISAEERLSEDLFDQLNVAISDTEARYPVFLLGRDQSPRVSEAPYVMCQPRQSANLIEGFEITFGRVGDAAELDMQQTVEVSAGPAGAIGQAGWRTLLGFVKWNATIKRFTEVFDDSDGVGRRYAGVRADDVIARGGSLALRSAPRTENGKPAMVIDQSNGGELRFGLQDSTGSVTPVFTVNASGDLHAEGKITGAIAGGVQIESGVATDGTLVPLPPGITQAHIDSGDATIHVHVTPRYQAPTAFPPLLANEYWLMTPIECRVEGRRVFCRFRWETTNPAGLPPGFPAEFVLPGVCDYTVMAFVRAATGGNP